MLKNATKILKQLPKEAKEDSLLGLFENAWRDSFAFFHVSLLTAYSVSGSHQICGTASSRRQR